MNLLLIRFNHASSTKNASWSPPTVWQLYKKRMCSYKNTKWYKSSNDQRENNYLSTSLNPFIMVAPEFAEIGLYSLSCCPHCYSMNKEMVSQSQWCWFDLKLLFLVSFLLFLFLLVHHHLHAFFPAAPTASVYFWYQLSSQPCCLYILKWPAFHHHFTSSATRVNSFEWLRVSSDTITAICVVVMVINLPTVAAIMHHKCITFKNVSYEQECVWQKG